MDVGTLRFARDLKEFGDLLCHLTGTEDAAGPSGPHADALAASFKHVIDELTGLDEDLSRDAETPNARRILDALACHLLASAIDVYEARLEAIHVAADSPRTGGGAP